MVNVPLLIPFDIKKNVEIKEFFNDFEEFYAVNLWHMKKCAQVLGNYLKWEAKEAFHSLNGPTRLYIEIKELHWEIK